MDIKVYEKSLENFKISERTKLLMRARSVDNMLGNLPGESEWKALNPEGPSLKEKRASLVVVREETLAALETQPLDLADELSCLKSAAIGLPVCEAGPARRSSRKSAKDGGFGALVNRVFTDGPCPDPTPETLYIDPEEIYKQRSDDERPWYYEVTERNEEGTSVIFRLHIADTNNDPWNKDYMEGWLRIFWVYDLPAWSYDANYELGIHGSMNISAEIFSNNILGRRWWAGYYAGGLAADNELVQISNEYQPIYHSQNWIGDPVHWNSGQVHMTKNLFLEAGESRKIFHYYWVYLFADRGRVETIGSVTSYNNFNFLRRPRLRCTIRPVL